MQLTDEQGRVLVNEQGVEVKMMVEVTGNDDPRNSVDIGDMVKVTCRRNAKGWCSVTINQNFEILRSCQVQVRTIEGLVTGRGKIKNYKGVTKMFVAVNENRSNGNEMKLMVEIDADLNEYGRYTSDDPNARISKGDTVRFQCTNRDFDESGWCNVKSENLQVLDDSGQQEWQQQRELSRRAAEQAKIDEKRKVESWFKSKTGVSKTKYMIELMISILQDLKNGPKMLGQGGQRSMCGYQPWYKPTGLRASSLHGKPSNQRNSALRTLIQLGAIESRESTKYPDREEYTTFSITELGLEMITSYYLAIEDD